MVYVGVIMMEMKKDKYVRQKKYRRENIKPKTIDYVRDSPELLQLEKYLTDNDLQFATWAKELFRKEIEKNS